MSKERERKIMSICRKREKKYVSIRAHILILVLLTTEVHSGEGSDNYPGWFKQKKRNGGQREPRAQEEAIGRTFQIYTPESKKGGTSDFVLTIGCIYFRSQANLLFEKSV